MHGTYLDAASLNVALLPLNGVRLHTMSLAVAASIEPAS